MEPEDLPVGPPIAVAAFEQLLSRLEDLGPFEVRTSKSQIAFWGKHGFADLWLPGQYLFNPQAEVVLSIALGAPHDSPRFKEIVHPAERHCRHHLELHGPGEIDDEVMLWLREAVGYAG